MPNGNGRQKYRATARRADQAWIVHVEGMGLVAHLEARDLTDVEPRLRKQLGRNDRTETVDVDLDVRMEPTVQVHLDQIRECNALLDRAYDAAIDAMVDEGLTQLDISRVLGLYRRTSRPLTISNAEVAACGLERHPEAVGLEWDDHGHFRSRKCRDCVETTRKEYRELAPEGENALVYEGEGFACDFCDVGHEVTA